MYYLYKYVKDLENCRFYKPNVYVLIHLALIRPSKGKTKYIAGPSSIKVFYSLKECIVSYIKYPYNENYMYIKANIYKINNSDDSDIVIEILEEIDQDIIVNLFNKYAILR